MTVPSKSRCHHDGDDRFEAFEKAILEACKRTWDDDVQANENAESILAELHRCDASGREYYMTDKGEYYYYRVSHGHRIATGTSETLVEAGELSGSRYLHPLAYMKLHTAVKKLKDSGMPEKQAESVVGFQARLINQNLATKAEISDLTTQNAEIRTGFAEIRNEFTEIRTGTKEIADLLLI